MVPEIRETRGDTKMSKTHIKSADKAATSCVQLALFMEGEVQLTETQFDGHVDNILELLEESNNHRYRFGRTIPRTE